MLSPGFSPKKVANYSWATIYVETSLGTLSNEQNFIRITASFSANFSPLMG
jgi:hypothetical protein